MKPNHHPDDFLQEQILRECQAMAKHVFACGLPVAPSVVQTIENFARQRKENGEKEMGKTQVAVSIQDLVQAHAQLAHGIAPATPKAILLLDKDFSQGIAKFLGPIPFMRWMTLLSIFFLLLFSTITISPSLLTKVLGENLWATLGGAPFLEQLILLAAAGLGASFSTLFKANEYVLSGTFDKKYESSYWIRFFLGLLAGIILVQIIPMDPSFKAYGKPTIALLGGFSSPAVYKIISRLIEAFEAIVPGHKKNLQEQILKTHLWEQSAWMRWQKAQEEKNATQDPNLWEKRLAEEKSREQLRLASTILEAQKEMKEGLGTEQVQKILANLLTQLLSTGEKKIEANTVTEQPSKEKSEAVASVLEEAKKETPEKIETPKPPAVALQFLQFEDEKASREAEKENPVSDTPLATVVALSEAPKTSSKQVPPVNKRHPAEDEELLPLKIASRR